MKKILAALSLSLLAACGQNGRVAATSATKDLSDGVPNAFAQTYTGVGSRAELYLYENGNRPGLLYVWYFDMQHYFGDYGPLKGLVKIHTPRGTGTQTVDLGTYGGDGEGIVYGTHLAQVQIKAHTVVDSVELAFSNPAGDKWDSDLGRNYRVTLRPN